MIRKLLLVAFLVVGFSNGALAQNPTCPNRPLGDSSNACANTRFVIQNAGGGGGTPGGSNGQVQYNNAGSFGGLTNAQLTALVQQFSSTLSGAVPASGGGTVNFLRADGTWTTPSVGALSVGSTAITGGAGGILYDNAGVLGSSFVLPVGTNLLNATSLPISTGLSDVAWTSYSPTITVQIPGVTPPTITVNSARYKQIGKTVFVVVDFTFTNGGTGTGQTFIPLPLASTPFNFTGIAFEYAQTLTSGAAYIPGTVNTSRAQSSNSVGATWVGTNKAVVVEITYEVP